MDSINTMLVSVYVVTYNSAEYVIETLNSVYNQTYNNIELIITDDASTDNTIELCKRWLNNHQDRFSDVQLVTSAINTGISANCNRAVKVAKGYWLKGIAGDDILLPNCVSDNVDYISRHNHISFLFSRRLEFGDTKEIENIKRNRNKREYFYDMPSKQQFWDLVMNECCLPACTAFIHRQTLLSLGAFDESVPMYEDFPLWVKATKCGYKMWLMDVPTVKYRVAASGISFGRNKHCLNRRFASSMMLAFKKYRYPFIKMVDVFYANYLYLYYKGYTSTNKMLSVMFQLLRYVYRLMCLRYHLVPSSTKIERVLTKDFSDVKFDLQ